MGRWFEIAKLPAQFERGRCIETNFTLKLDGTAHVASSEILWVPTSQAVFKGSLCYNFICFIELHNCIINNKYTKLNHKLYFIRKGELRTIDGTAVVEDKKNPAKLGISFSYGTKLIFFFWAFARSLPCVFFIHFESYFTFCFSAWIYSFALHSILDFVHWLWEFSTGIFMHWCLETVSCRLRLDSGPHPIPACCHHRPWKRGF